MRVAGAEARRFAKLQSRLRAFEGVGGDRLRTVVSLNLINLDRALRDLAQYAEQRPLGNAVPTCPATSSSDTPSSHGDVAAVE